MSPDAERHLDVHGWVMLCGSYDDNGETCDRVDGHDGDHARGGRTWKRREGLGAFIPSAAPTPRERKPHE